MQYFEPTPEQKRKRRISMLSFLSVLVLLVVLCVYAFAGRNDTTRTHFTATATEFRPLTESEASQADEFRPLYEAARQKKSLIYNAEFSEQYPTVTKVMLDRDFCSDEVELRSGDTGEYLWIIDGYIADYDYLRRGLDILLIPYTHTADSMTVLSPVRFSLVFDSTLSTVTGSLPDEENYRLSFYTLDVTVQGDTDGFDYALAMSGTQKDKKHQGKHLFAASGKQEAKKVAPSVTSTGLSGSCGKGQTRLRVEFDDVSWKHFGSLTLSSLSENASFCVGVNQ